MVAEDRHFAVLLQMVRGGAVDGVVRVGSAGEAQVARIHPLRLQYT